MKKLLTSLGFGLGAAAFAVASVSAATTTVVTGDTAAGENTPGWMFNRDPRTATSYEFNDDEAVIGVGALYAGPIQNNNHNSIPGNTATRDKFIGENFINSLVSETESISFDFKIGAGGQVADAQHFYINVYTNFGESDNNKFYDCRYDVVATSGSLSDWTTVTFDPTATFASNRITQRADSASTPTINEASPHTCPAVPADMDTLSDGSNIRAFAINMGDTSAEDQDLDGYFDNVVTAVDGETTIYDFEPTLTPTNKNDCKNGGWATFNTPAFKNQGQCVSYLEKSPKANGPANLNQLNF